MPVSCVHARVKSFGFDESLFKIGGAFQRGPDALNARGVANLLAVVSDIAFTIEITLSDYIGRMPSVRAMRSRISSMTSMPWGRRNRGRRLRCFMRLAT